MTDEIFLQLSQEHETPVTVQQRHIYGYRYAYSRSADSQANEDKGQDYLAYRENGQRLVFALCDGVSQSFYGDLAARLLGEGLTYWLWNRIPLTSETFQKDLEIFLDSLVEQASKQVVTHSIPLDLAPMIRQVLEQKRTVGSESTFTAGLCDFAAGQLFLVWMGDSRLRLWGQEMEITNQLGDSFLTAERWSTRRGRIGDLHTFSMPVKDLQYLIAYSDGLARLDKIMARHFRDSSIHAVIEDALLRPESDDASFFEVWLGRQHPLERPPLSAPLEVKLEVEEGQTRIRWRPVAGAALYEVRLDDGQLFTVYAPGRSLELPKDTLKTDAHTARVRAWDDEPGEWSVKLSLPQEHLKLAISPQEVNPTSSHQTEPVMPNLVPLPTATPPFFHHSSTPPPPTPIHPLIHYPPTPLPPPTRSFQWNQGLIGGLTILLCSCVLILGLISWPTSPIHEVFFPFSLTPSMPQFTLPPTASSEPMIASETFTLTPEPSILKTLMPTQDDSALAASTETLSIPIKTITPGQSVITQQFCAVRDIPETDIVVSPLQQQGTIGWTLKSGVCLEFDGWNNDTPNYGSYWLRIAPEQPGFEELTGKWILANRLKTPKDETMLTLPQIILGPVFPTPEK